MNFDASKIDEGFQCQSRANFHDIQRLKMSNQLADSAQNGPIKALNGPIKALHGPIKVLNGPIKANLSKQ